MLNPIITVPIPGDPRTKHNQLHQPSILLPNSPQETKPQISDIEAFNIIVSADDEGVRAVENWESFRADLFAGAGDVRLFGLGDVGFLDVVAVSALYFDAAKVGEAGERVDLVAKFACEVKEAGAVGVLGGG
jgi:hypothetical protein